MKLLIADDEPLARARLRSLAAEIAEVDIAGEAANGKQALYLSCELAPDIILLDIRMPVMDGLEAAQHLAALENPPAVIFTTAYGDHALAAFEAQAVDYLLKPIRKERLEQALSKAGKLNRAQLHAVSQHRGDGNSGSRARTHVSAHSAGKIELVAVSDILYFQADQKYVTVRHTAGKVLIEESLKSLEEEFAGHFTRIHRNALVANAYLAGMSKNSAGHCEAILRGCGDTLEISRSHLATVKKMLTG
ncbi:MAG: response regulator transcription factor [Gammaproteobacteria bacterium]|nr:response regulator transcription factor [Gammaproteobacteria bacterium]